MRKIRFIIVGSGWRAFCYVRIAKALPQVFELCAMYCRTKEKAEKMAAQYQIRTTTSIEECLGCHPDFAVVAVTKTDIAKVSMEWLDYGCAVLCETPAAMELSDLHRLWQRKREGQKLVVAEQYTHYPAYGAMKKVFEKNWLGTRDVLNLSLAHEYHGASLMREFLQIENGRPFRVSGRMYEFPTVETLTRYERFTDGRIAAKKRTAAVFEFEGGPVAFYDFDSEQYRSPIRKNTMKLQGSRGEFIDGRLYYLDSENEAKEAQLTVHTRSIHREYDNPNLSDIEEVTEIDFDGECVYTPAFGLCGLTQDETAVAVMMKETAAYAKGEAEPPYPLENALTDAYMAILLREACGTGKVISSEPQGWE